MYVHLHVPLALLVAVGYDVSSVMNDWGGRVGIWFPRDRRVRINNKI